MATVLVVDDHQPSLELASLIVKDAGHDVLEASDGLTALALARQWRPAAILLDMDLGFASLSGWDVVRRLKSDPATRTIQVLAVTALAMPGDRERALDAGCNMYVSKPFDCVFLLSALEAALALSAIGLFNQHSQVQSTEPDQEGCAGR